MCCAVFGFVIYIRSAKMGEAQGRGFGSPFGKKTQPFSEFGCFHRFPIQIRELSEKYRNLLRLATIIWQEGGLFTTEFWPIPACKTRFYLDFLNFIPAFRKFFIEKSARYGGTSLSNLQGTPPGNLTCNFHLFGTPHSFGTLSLGVGGVVEGCGNSSPS